MPCLEVREVHKAFGGTRVLGGASLALDDGEFVAIVGYSGSGKTTLISLIAGLLAADAGEIVLDGRPLRLRSPADAIAAGVGYLAENRKADGLFFNLLAPPNITIARLDGISAGPFLALGREWRRARSLVRELRLAPGAERRNVAFLSGGNQQKVVLARWLFAEARVLLLDEPTQGLDVGAKREVYDLIDELTARGVGIVLISSDYPELLSISDRIAVVRDGRIVHTASHGELSQQELIELASAGTAKDAA
jgi:ribose transport system ATP-binding protein